MPTEELAAHNTVKKYVIHIDGLETEFVLLIMTGREASETDGKLK